MQIEEEQENDAYIEPVPDRGRSAAPLQDQPDEDMQGEEMPMHIDGEVDEDPKIRQLRGDLKILFAQNPDLKMPEMNDNLRLVDLIPPEQVEIIYHLAIQSMNKDLDHGFAHAAIDMICNVLPGVDNTKLKEQISGDQMFVSSLTTFMGMKLSALPPSVKLFILGAMHLFRTFKLPLKRKAEDQSVDGSDQPGSKQR